MDFNNTTNKKYEELNTELEDILNGKVGYWIEENGPVWPRQRGQRALLNIFKKGDNEKDRNILKICKEKMLKELVAGNYYDYAEYDYDKEGRETFRQVFYIEKIVKDVLYFTQYERSIMLEFGGAETNWIHKFEGHVKIDNLLFAFYTLGAQTSLNFNAVPDIRITFNEAEPQILRPYMEGMEFYKEN